MHDLIGDDRRHLSNAKDCSRSRPPDKPISPVT